MHILKMSRHFTDIIDLSSFTEYNTIFVNEENNGEGD
jgi:hypothetical protein